MKRIVEIITKLLAKDPPKLLGRWNIDYCSKKINNKIDLSNEDHCGPCGQYIITKTPNIPLHDVKKNEVSDKSPPLK